MTLLFALVGLALAEDPWKDPGAIAASAWMDEGSVVVRGLSDRPLVGGGIVRRLGGGTWLGGRFHVPVWGRGPYEGDLFVRGYFTPDRSASLFVEGDVSVWVGQGLAAPSAGVALGVRVRVHERLCVGGSMGPTAFPTAASPGVDALDLGPVGLVPTMRASVDFLL